jgi:hypothetical protein
MPLSVTELRNIQRILRRAMELLEDAATLARTAGDPIKEQQLLGAWEAVKNEFSDTQARIIILNQHP